MKVRFLLDENISPRIRVAIQRHYPDIDVLRVGDEGAPLLHSLDTDILLYLETAKRLLITSNRASMPGHVAEHFDNGRMHLDTFLI